MNQNKTHLPRISWRPFEVAQILGVSLAFIRKEIRLKHIKITKLGRAIVILDEDLRNYIQKKVEQIV